MNTQSNIFKGHLKWQMVRQHESQYLVQEAATIPPCPLQRKVLEEK